MAGRTAVAGVVPPGRSPGWAGCRVSVMSGVETRKAPSSGTSNSWITVPMAPRPLSRTTTLA
jgi:hypothetical protein